MMPDANTITLISAVLIFLAAVVPIIYKIWEKAKDSKTQGILIRNILAIIVVILMIGSACSFIFYDDLLITLALFITIWIILVGLFLTNGGPVDRLEVLALIVVTSGLIFFTLIYLMRLLYKTLTV